MRDGTRHTEERKLRAKKSPYWKEALGIMWLNIPQTDPLDTFTEEERTTCLPQPCWDQAGITEVSNYLRM